MSKPRSFHVPGSFRHYLPDREFRTEHIRIDLRVDPEEKSIQGRSESKIAVLAHGTTSLRFDAVEMTVSRVLLDGKPVRFEHDGVTLTVLSAEPLHGTHTLGFEYSAHPRHGVYFVHPDDAYPDKPVQAWTQSEAEAARFWFPCRDHPDDKSTTETVITAPDGYDVISTGRLESRTSSGGWSTYHWSESAPHSTYLNSFVVGKFVETKAMAGEVPLSYYAPQSKSENTMRYFGLTPEMMRVFEEITGCKYPFEKYAQVAVHDFIYGGMENISATTLVDTRFPDARTEEDYQARYSRPDRNHVELVAHELAHMWFGDLVTTRDWSHAWLNEGFATYMEALFVERKYGKDDFRQNMLFKANAHFEEDADKYRRPIVENDYLYPDDLFDTCVYEKAAWMIHQLRYILGDEAFFRSVREYVKRFQYGSVDTHDFRRLVEEVTGVSLERYFEQSFFKGGYPELKAEYSWDASNRLARVRLTQVQAVDEMTPSFQLPCDLVFYTEKGRQKRRVQIRGGDESFVFELDSEPRIVEVDPEGWLLKKLTFKKSRSLLLNQLASSIDDSSRREAAADLASFKDDPEVVDALKRAAEGVDGNLRHWAVRAEAVRSIGKVGGRRALEALLSMRSVANRRVRRAVIEALADYKGDADAEAFVRETLFHDASPYIQCEAALSLAKLKGASAIPDLTEAMKIPSPEDGLTEACLEALGRTKSSEVRETLKTNMAYGRPTRVRVGALKGYAKVGTVSDAEVGPIKDIIEKDRDYIVRSQALTTIGELHDKRFQAALSNVAANDPDNRNRRRATELLVDLDSVQEDEAIRRLSDEVAKLRAENAEIRAELSRVARSGSASESE